MKTGIELIAEERAEHFTKHGRTIQRDAFDNNSGELLMAANALIVGEYGHFPSTWDDAVCRKMSDKPIIERLAIAGALIAAEIDRLNHITGWDKI